MPIFSKASTEIANKAVGIVEKLVPDSTQKHEIASNIVNAEMASGHGFLRNARPTIIYIGLVLIVLEFFGLRLLSLKIMEADANMVDSSTSIFHFFLLTWSGVVSIYIGGRSYEKTKNKILKKSTK